MTKKPLLDRVVMAYRPLYLQGLLLDGQYRLPPATAHKRNKRQRHMLLAALTGLRHIVSPRRNRP